MKKHNRCKKTAALLLTMAIVIATLPATVGSIFVRDTVIIANAAAVLDSGTCGSNVNWVLYNDGILTISGEGKMDDYIFSFPSPWNAYTNSIKTVIIENGVTNIGNDAFTKCNLMTSIFIPDSVSSIGMNAFKDCGLLSSVTLPNGLQTIGSSAFESCISLASIKLPNSVNSIGQYAFYGCSSLISVAIPEGVETIEDLTFCRCSKLNSVTIPDSVKRIEFWSFLECSSLTSVNIPDSVEIIEENAFAGCISLTSVSLPNKLKTIERFVFCNCSSLTSVTVPESVTYIREYSFYGCTALSSVLIKATTPPSHDYMPSIFFTGDFETGLPNNFKIYVPDTSVETYKNEWSDLADIIVSSTPLISEVSITLNDGFGLNFYIDRIIDSTGYTVKFSGKCDENGKQVALTEKNGRFCATASINVNDINEQITATLCKDGIETDIMQNFSVNDYLKTAIASAKNSKTLAMFKAIQIYGLAAEEYFYYTDNGVSNMLNVYFTENGFTDEKLMGMLINYKAESVALGNNKVSLVLNSRVKLRVYSDKGTKTNNNGRYSEITGLTPINMCKNQILDGYSVSGYTWVYRVLTSNDETVLSKNEIMAKALFAYMQTIESFDANDFKLYDLSKLTEDFEAKDGDILTGKLEKNIQISVAAGATITLKDVDITNLNVPMAGISCYNDATIILEGNNIIKGGLSDIISEPCPGIFISYPKTLTINGTGSLDVSGYEYSSGIGGGYFSHCGNIVINGGNITATGGNYSTGIGSGEYGSCGNITISGGNIIARGGAYAAAIGLGRDGFSCGDITITIGVTSVTATKGENADVSIATGDEYDSGSIIIEDGANVILN